MKTLRLLSLCLLTSALVGCATPGPAKTGTLQFPPVEYVK